MPELSDHMSPFTGDDGTPAATGMRNPELPVVAAAVSSNPVNVPVVAVNACTAVVPAETVNPPDVIVAPPLATVRPVSPPSVPVMVLLPVTVIAPLVSAPIVNAAALAPVVSSRNEAAALL